MKTDQIFKLFDLEILYLLIGIDFARFEINPSKQIEDEPKN